jgi:anti-sigma factor RsiW
MNEHRDVRELLTLAAAGALGPAAQRRVEDHLRQCRECRAEIESWQRLTGALRAMPTPQAPMGLVESTRRQMASRAAARAEQRHAQSLLLGLTGFAWISTVLTWPLFHFWGGRVADLLDIPWTNAGVTGAWLGYIVVAWMATAIVTVLLGKARQQERIV